MEGKDPEELTTLIQEAVTERYDEKEEEMSEERMREFEKVVLLRAIDSKWTDHIDAMDQFVTEFTYVHMVKLIRFVSIKRRICDVRGNGRSRSKMMQRNMR